ncbi:hypothetical protein GGR52DRAFT_526508 [Hypoxylon sp. FL1284]|nr:hypothetical protein GGR52DRAFT_526508 [Hypoxylon sp. FL1284]
MSTSTRENAIEISGAFSTIGLLTTFFTGLIPFLIGINCACSQDMDGPLAKAPDNVLRAVLMALCADPDTNLKATAYLEKITSKANSDVSESPDASESKPRKRKATEDVRICTQCQEPFYDDENNAQACQFHDGNLEVDDEGDFWADHDENCHGVIDTEGMREDYPEGFIWDCCGEDGTTDGCARGYHTTAGTHKGRYAD